MSKRVASIEGLRVLLFLGIFLFHCSIPLFSMGWGGVNVFLVLTSFLLTDNIIKKDRHTIIVLSTIKHRINRIYPAYIFIVFSCVAAYIFINHALPKDFLPLLLCSQNFWWAIDGMQNATIMTGHLWYITLDIYLCIIWIIALRIIPRKRLNFFFVLCIIIGIGWRVSCVLLKTSSLVAYSLPIGQIDSFAIGGLIALFRIPNNRKSILNAYLIITVGLLGIFTCLLITSHINNISIQEAFLAYNTSKGYASNIYTVNIFLFMSILGAGLILICLNHPNMPILSSSAFVTIGALTYFLYLVHYPIIIIVRHFAPYSLLRIVIVLLISILIATVCDKFFSKFF